MIQIFIKRNKKKYQIKQKMHVYLEKTTITQLELLDKNFVVC